MPDVFEDTNDVSIAVQQSLGNLVQESSPAFVAEYMALVLALPAGADTKSCQTLIKGLRDLRRKRGFEGPTLTAFEVRLAANISAAAAG